MEKADNRLLIALIVILLPVSLFYGSGVLELRAEEPRRAIVALEMYLSGNYIVPKINGTDYYNKPPLFNWLIAACYKLFNSFDECVVRFPSLLSLLLTGIVHYFFSRRYIGSKVALVSALCFITSSDIFYYGTINAGEIDLFYTLLVYLQVVSIFIFYERKQYFLLFTVSYLITSLGVITKGPPSLAFQALTLLVWFVYNKEFKRLFYWQHLTGIAVLVLVAGGYFYMYAQQADIVGLLTRLTKEATQRTAAEGGIWKSLTGFIVFPFLVWRLLLPWSVFVFAMLRKDAWHIIKQNRFVLFCLLFIAANFIIYSLSSEVRNRYIYMFFPFITTLLMYLYYQDERRFVTVKLWLNRLFLLAMVLGTIACVALPIMPYVKQLNYIWLKAILYALVCACITYWYWTSRFNMLVVVLFAIVIRLSFPIFYYPVVADNEYSYKLHADKILSIANGGEIFWADNAYVFTSDIKLGPLSVGKRTHTTASLIAYQIPYYITKQSGKIMQFTTMIEKDKLYLSPESFVDGKSVDVLYTMKDNWMQRQLLLVRAK